MGNCQCCCCCSDYEVVVRKIDDNTSPLMENKAAAPKPHRKQPISKALHSQIWARQFGQNIQGQCPICFFPIYRDRGTSWHAGHVIPEARGGPTDLDNLRAICAQCNASMGAKTFYEYIDLKHPEHRADILRRAILQP